MVAFSLISIQSNAVLNSCNNDKIDIGSERLNIADFICTFTHLAHFAILFQNCGHYIPGTASSDDGSCNRGLLWKIYLPAWAFALLLLPYYDDRLCSHRNDSFRIRPSVPSIYIASRMWTGVKIFFQFFSIFWMSPKRLRTSHSVLTAGSLLLLSWREPCFGHKIWPYQRRQLAHTGSPKGWWWELWIIDFW